MMRIAGITIPEDKRLEIGLTAVYGVGRSRARETLSEVGIDPGKLPKDLSESEEASVREAVEKFAIEGELRRMISGNIRRLKDIHTYRGSRHAKNLPARGQGTKTNSRTVRGNKRVTMTSGRRKLEKT
ncbi:MAG: 30S ribosomal protein S13 [bacterium]|nr:30S ribosomal protein S13 [bacterium]